MSLHITGVLILDLHGREDIYNLEPVPSTSKSCIILSIQIYNIKYHHNRCIILLLGQQLRYFLQHCQMGSRYVEYGTRSL